MWKITLFLCNCDALEAMLLDRQKKLIWTEKYNLQVEFYKSLCIFGTLQHKNNAWVALKKKQEKEKEYIEL